MSRKKSLEPGLRPPSPEGTEGPPPRNPRRRFWIAAGAVAAVVAALLGFAATLPGHQDPNAGLGDCYHRLGLVTTAILRWSRTHGDSFPSSLDDLREAGLLAVDPAFARCPSALRAYAYVPGLRPDMPGSTVLVSCPEGAGHEELRSGYPPGSVALFAGVDLKIRGERASRDPASGGEGRTGSSKFERRLEAQRRVLELFDRLRRGEGEISARAGLEGMLGNGTAGPLAAWAMGASGDRAFLPVLSARRRPDRAPGRGPPEPGDEFDVAVARALLRLGDRSAVPLLIESLDSAEGALREQARAALEESFRGANPPLPRLRSYVAIGDAKGEAEALNAWWKA
ncbi:MAG: hypothetical protein MUC63_04960, partial [Planctomycetes bacterium]|nr:hypothetical protein [Planctomycetota bacterium]